MLNLILTLLVTAGIWNFDKDKENAVPANFEFGTTQDAPAARWVVKKDGKDQVLAQIENQTKARFALALVKGEKQLHVSVAARLKIISGYQAAGVVFRAQDVNNYYVARTNTAEGNVQLLRYVDGKRSKLVTVPIKGLKAGEWHTLRAEQQGIKISVFVNDAHVFDAEDATFNEGRAGVWAKDDTVAHFDNVEVKALPAPVAKATPAAKTVAK
jgi:hypothetical protein